MKILRIELAIENNVFDWFMNQLDYVMKLCNVKIIEWRYTTI